MENMMIETRRIGATLLRSLPALLHTLQLPSGETTLIDAADRALVEAYGPWFAYDAHTAATHGTFAWLNGENFDLIDGV